MLAAEPAVTAAGGTVLANAQKFDFARQTWQLQQQASGGDKLKQLIGEETTVSDFVAMTRWDQIRMIDRMWREMIIVVIGNTPRSQMVDPVPGQGRAFLSSASANRPFANQGYCFRCDTRAPGAVTAQGFRRRYEFSPPPEIQGTVMEKLARGIGCAPQLVMWKANRDALSEMVICVARQMRGSTKFPNPEHVGAAYIYAIKLAPDKKGFDTERWQEDPKGGGGGSALWQPGEKAFYDIAGSDVLAHVPIQKLGKPMGAPAGALFQFQFSANVWSWAGANAADQRFLNAELASIYNGGAIQTVLETEDFYRPA